MNCQKDELSQKIEYPKIWDSTKYMMSEKIKGHKKLSSIKEEKSLNGEMGWGQKRKL